MADIIESRGADSRTVAPRATGPATGIDATGPDTVVPPDAGPTGPIRPPRWENLRTARILIPLALVVVVGIIAAFPGLFAGWFGHGDPRDCDLINSSAGPRSGHPFGFDVQGCDLYANVIHGTRSSVLIGVLVTGLALVVSVLLGALAGYFRGWVDAVISRVMDVFFGFPSLVGMIILLNTFSSRTVWTVSMVIALFMWPGFTRIFRSSVLSTASLDYVVAAKQIGASTPRILAQHVIPNSIGPLAAVLSLSVGGIITAEAALTFLGVGLQAPAISWGVQLNSARRYFTTDLHLLIFPSIFLSITVLAFVLLGDALRHVLDPKAKGATR